ncbi:MAG TPA: GTPase domain-containing protein, partial [Gemmatales bacterium]|nr:GTPase domain-containing protein [Gemmatales bacterium]
QVRQIQGLPEAASELSLLTRAVIWDCPDMTTWKANQYQTRLVETLGLADLVIYVASDERYNDAWPTQYLQYLLQAGKPVVACLTKMQPSQQETLLKHFRETVISRIPECAGVSAVVALPHLSAAEQADPGGVGNGIRQPLVQAV